MSKPARAIVLLLAGLAAYFLMLEVFAREIYPRISSDQRRIVADAQAALALRPTDATGARTVVLLGNSLLLHAIDRAQLRALMGPDFHVVLYPIEDTAYYDWLYGLRHLLHGGSRPSAVVLCISAKHLLSDSTAGEEFAYLLMQLQDLPDVARDSHLNMMSASEYMFANLSAWLGSRSTFRNGLMERWLPDADALAVRLAARGPAPPVINGDSTRRGLERLQAVRTLVEAQHAQFIWLVPPTLYAKDVAPALARAAAPAGIAVLIPSLPAQLPHAAYMDGFHLNAQGAAQFTPLAASALRDELGRLLWPDANPAGAAARRGP